MSEVVWLRWGTACCHGLDCVLVFRTAISHATTTTGTASSVDRGDDNALRRTGSPRGIPHISLQGVMLVERVIDGDPEKPQSRAALIPRLRLQDLDYQTHIERLPPW
jgi:hypothetical protein